MVKFTKAWGWNSAEFAWLSASTPHVWDNFPVSSLQSEPTVGHFRVDVHASDRYVAAFTNIAYGVILLWSVSIDGESDPRDTSGFGPEVVARGSLRLSMDNWVPPHDGQSNWQASGRADQRSVSEGMRRAAPGGGGVFVNAAPHGPVSPQANPFIWIGIRYLVMLPPAPP